MIRLRSIVVGLALAACATPAPAADPFVLYLLRMLRDRLRPATVEAAEVLGWSADAIEAQAFGFLAARGLKGLPLSYPATTGVPMPMTGGLIARP